MLRVSRAGDPSLTIITIDGQLSADCIEFLENLCNREIATAPSVHLFLRDLTMIDRSGWALLRRLAAKGVRLLASGVYTSYVVQALTSTKNSGR